MQLRKTDERYVRKRMERKEIVMQRERRYFTKEVKVENLRQI